MTRLSLFNHPFLLGFEEFERTLDRVAKSAGDGYPPYNIEQTGEKALRITLAVAGFGPEDLSVQVEDNGRGFQAQEQSGHGLENMRTRLKQIGGSCEWVSTPGSGTVVEFRLPLKQPVPGEEFSG